MGFLGFLSLLMHAASHNMDAKTLPASAWLKNAGLRRGGTSALLLRVHLEACQPPFGGSGSADLGGSSLAVPLGGF